jgi:BTB And C-terminal Kelch
MNPRAAAEAASAAVSAADSAASPASPVSPSSAAASSGSTQPGQPSATQNAQSTPVPATAADTASTPTLTTGEFGNFFLDMDFLRFFDSGDFSDAEIAITFVSHEEKRGSRGKSGSKVRRRRRKTEVARVFKVHRMILALTAGYFRSRLEVEGGTGQEEAEAPEEAEMSEPADIDDQPAFASRFEIDLADIMLSQYKRFAYGNSRSREARHLQISAADAARESANIEMALRFCYGEEIPITLENALPLLRVAEFFAIETLTQRLSQFVGARIRWQEAARLIDMAQDLRMTAIVERCLYAIAKHYAYLHGVDFSFMSYGLFLSLLQHANLNITDEKQLYETVCEYVANRRDSLSQDEVNTLFACVRLRWLSFSDLSKVAQNPVVPPALLMEALVGAFFSSSLFSLLSIPPAPAPLFLSLFSDPVCCHFAARLQVHETGTACPEAAPSNRASAKSSDQPIARLQRRERFSVTVEFVEDTPEFGVLHWIGTQGGLHDWQHPGTLGVAVTASSSERGNMMDVVRTITEKTEFWTGDVPSSWVCIDLGPGRTVLPTHYTLVHGGNYVADLIRTWHLQGSADGEKWVILRSHGSDTSLNAKFARHTWEIDGPSWEGIEGGAGGFRYFRILQHGHNSSKRNFLLLAGIELYGELYDDV